MADLLDNGEPSHGQRVRLAILEMGLTLWRVDPAYVTSRRIAAEMNLSHSTVLYHFVTAAKLRDAIAFHAVRQGESRVIMHLIAMGHASVKSMSDEARADHMRSAR